MRRFIGPPDLARHRWRRVGQRPHRWSTAHPPATPDARPAKRRSPFSLRGLRDGRVSPRDSWRRSPWREGIVDPRAIICVHLSRLVQVAAEIRRCCRTASSHPRAVDITQSHCPIRSSRPHAEQYRESSLGEVAICRECLLDAEIRGDEDADAIRQTPILVRALLEQRKCRSSRADRRGYSASAVSATRSRSTEAPRT